MRIVANINSGKTVVSKSELEQRLTDEFRKRVMDDVTDNLDNYFYDIKIYQDGDYVAVKIGAEYDFDENEILDYYEYRDLMEEFGEGGPIMSREEYYNQMRNAPTLVDKMDEVLKSYNPDWYFELYDACHIEAYLDNCILEV